MKRILVVAAGSVAGALGAAGLIMAAPASAQPMDFSCAPCVVDIDGDGEALPIWNEVTQFGPWETFFELTNGNATDGKGAWESGVEAVNGGAWEKAFPAE